MKNKLEKFIPVVFGFLQKIPKGKVVTYKIVADNCGIKNPRNVGWILKQNTEQKKTPCFKVVLSSGRLAEGYKFGGKSRQKHFIMKEGVKINEEGVVLPEFIWRMNRK